MVTVTKVKYGDVTNNDFHKGDMGDSSGDTYNGIIGDTVIYW